jgi:hypothetical protein
MGRMAGCHGGTRVALVAAAVLALALPAAAQVNLSGRWELNREQSDDPQERMQELGGGRGGALAGLLGSIDPERLAELRARGGGRGSGGGFGDGTALAGMRDQIESVRALFDMPAALVLIQDAEVLSITHPDGQVRRVPVEPGASMVNGREVRTRWESGRLVSETLLSETMTLVETFERAESGQLVMTAHMDLQGRPMSLRRVYDPVRAE